MVRAGSGLVCALAILLSHGASAQQGQSESYADHDHPSAATSGHAGPGDLTADPSPARPGAYTRVCTHDYDLSPDSQQWGYARVYVPILEPEQCERLRRGDLVTLNRRFNLVVIAHADHVGFFEDAHLMYEGLAEHLASHAFIVVGMNRYMNGKVAGAIDVFETLLTTHLQHLYTSSPVRFSLEPNVALIGHSAGGRSVTRHAAAVESLPGLSLRAVVLLAPTVDLTSQISFDGVADAFLGMHVSQDGDASAYGTKSLNQPMQTAFMHYDRIGKLQNQHDVFTMTKSFVYIGHFGHYFQNELFTLGYVNAFLQQHLNGHQIFRRFLKFQEPIPGVDPNLRIIRQHQDTTRRTVADFEALDGAIANQLGGATLYGGKGFTFVTVQNAAVTDQFSPHDSGVLYFETAEGARTISFRAPAPINVGGFSHLGFRITQVYHPVENPSGEAIDFRVCLAASCGSAAVMAGEVGGALPFPSIVPMGTLPVPPNAPPGVTVFNGQTKNAMRSYLIRLADFEGANLAAVEAVTLDFDAAGPGVRIILDDVAFYRW